MNQLKQKTLHKSIYSAHVQVMIFVKAEVIMLTHNTKMHEYNLEHATQAEELLWQPDRQETKTSSYGSKNLRYKWQNKANYIKQFKQLHSEIIPWNTIRYIF